jgi:hypothetical protein
MAILNGEYLRELLMFAKIFRGVNQLPRERWLMKNWG